MSVNPPRPRGPHLNAMRCFETAARLGGFAAAAEELCVTAGAVSQQVNALEDWIGAPLFERRSQGVVLTALGGKVAREFTDAFNALGGALHSLRSSAPDVPINIAALPAIAQLWLSPRLPRVREAFPLQSISITALETAPNLSREVFDFSLFLGVPNGAPTQRVIVEDIIFPVCVPELARQIKTAKDLVNMPLILDSTWAEDWPLWHAQTGGQGVIEPRGERFSLYSLALEEARSGAGVMMGHACLVERDLACGTLVAPLDLHAVTGKSLILETPTPIASSARLACVLNALLV